MCPVESLFIFCKKKLVEIKRGVCVFFMKPVSCTKCECLFSPSGCNFMRARVIVLFLINNLLRRTQILEILGGKDKTIM